MTTIYLIRHSSKYRNFDIVENNDTNQITNEKIILDVEGEKKAERLSHNKELQNIDEVWSSNYVRAIQTAKYIAENNNKKLNISNSFDERHYGTVNKSDEERKQFWINQFKEPNLKAPDGESQLDVRERVEKKINELLINNKGKRIAIVAHNVCILFYILKYCKLEDAVVGKDLTISYNGNILFKNSKMDTPSIMKLDFNDLELTNITYIKDE